MHDISTFLASDQIKTLLTAVNSQQQYLTRLMVTSLNKASSRGVRQAAEFEVDIARLLDVRQVLQNLLATRGVSYD